MDGIYGHGVDIEFSRMRLAAARCFAGLAGLDIGVGMDVKGTEAQQLQLQLQLQQLHHFTPVPVPEHFRMMGTTASPALMAAAETYRQNNKD